MGLIPEHVTTPWERALRKLAAAVFEALEARANRYGSTDRAEAQRLNKRLHTGLHTRLHQRHSDHR